MIGWTEELNWKEIESEEVSVFVNGEEIKIKRSLIKELI
jgi:hypothetical protein